MLHIIRHGLLLLLLLTTFNVLSCTCEGVDESNVEAFLKQYDYVIIGRAIQNIHRNKTHSIVLDKKNQGSQVVFEIDSIIKGSLRERTIIINQFDKGNCSRAFQFQEQYLVLGNRIYEFDDPLINSNTKYNKGEIPLMEPPPPPSLYVDGKLQCTGCGEERIKFWNKVIEGNAVLNTGLCSSFAVGTADYEYLIRE